MNYTDYLTAIFASVAVSIIINVYRVVRWRDRAVKAEAALATARDRQARTNVRVAEWEDRYHRVNLALQRVEAEIDKTEQAITLSPTMLNALDTVVIADRDRITSGNNTSDRIVCDTADGDRDRLERAALYDLAKQVSPTELPEYVTDFRFEAMRDPAAGNGGGVDFIRFRWKIEGVEYNLAYSFPQLRKVLTARLTTDGVDAYWREYFDAVKAKIDREGGK
jgi:hypothetical protein